MEPGSTVKPFTLLAALESGKFAADTKVDTSPGYLRVTYKTFVDPKNYGVLDLAGILTKSSQVGTTKVALALDPDATRGMFERVGFGEPIGSGFPGEIVGELPGHQKLGPCDSGDLCLWLWSERLLAADGSGLLCIGQ